VLYRQTLSRQPNERERTLGSSSWLARKLEGVEDLLWAIRDVAEFQMIDWRTPMNRSFYFLSLRGAQRRSNPAGYQMDRHVASLLAMTNKA